MPENKPNLFKGFSPGKVAMIAVPDPFFSELLPLIDDLAELKVLLFCMWALPQKDGDFRYLLEADFHNDDSLMQGLAIIDPERDSSDILKQALARTVARKALLTVKVTLDTGEETLYFVNTARGQTAIEQIKAGQYTPSHDASLIEILPQRPSIYKLYESNIGALTPMIADELKDMEAEYPAEWLEEVLRIAVESNKRNLRYMRAILERWRTEGKTDLKRDDEKSEKDWEKYVTGKYADYIEH